MSSLGQLPKMWFSSTQRLVESAYGTWGSAVEQIPSVLGSISRQHEQNLVSFWLYEAIADVLRQVGTNSRKKSYEYISNKRKTKVSTAYYQKENNRGCIKIEILFFFFFCWSPLPHSFAQLLSTNHFKQGDSSRLLAMGLVPACSSYLLGIEH